MTRKQEALDGLDRILPGILDLGDQLFNEPELGFKEYRTADLISSYLSKHGIPHEKGLALTGVKASLGKEGYHIGLLADMDALEVQSGDGRRLIHSCGHSIQVTVMLAVIHVLAELDRVRPLAGRVSFVGTPAEEYVDLDFRRDLIDQGRIRYLSGKQNMIADGLFDDMDALLSCHIMGDDRWRFDLGSTLAGFTVKKAIFRGRSAHSGVAPHEGRNALHAASLCLQACAFVQQQFGPEAGARLYPILTEGGLSMNAIPEKAVLETYLRANSKEELFKLQSRFDDAARHSALALGMACEIEDTVGYLPLKQSDALNEVVYRNMLAICDPEEIDLKPVSGASGDIGDLASLLPAVQFGFTGMEGRVHSDRFQIRDPVKAYEEPAWVILGTVIDLLEKPDLQVKNPSYEEDKRAYLKNWLGQED